MSLWEPGGRVPAIRLMIDNPWWKGVVAEALLQHDTVTLPTADFTILPVLMQWAGPDILTDMLATGSLQFVRSFGSIGYFKGEGIDLYEARPDQGDPRTIRLAEREPPHDMLVPIVSSEEAASSFLTVVTERGGELRPEAKNHLVKLVLDHTVEVELRISFKEKVVDLTNADVQRKKTLRELTFDDLPGPRTPLGEFALAKPHDAPSFVPFDSLEPGAFRPFRSLYRVIPDEHQEADELDVLLWLAGANYEMALAEKVGSEHIKVSNFMRQALVRRRREPSSQAGRTEAFSTLLEVSDIPSLPEAFATSALAFDDVWKLRDSAKGLEFRGWFNEALEAGDAEEILAAYVHALTAENWATSVGVRVLRFLLSLVPIKSTAVAPVASLALDKVLDDSRPWTPKVFLDDFRKRTTK